MTKVIINPSRGGSDSGSITGTLIEKNYNLEIGKIIANNLRNLGIDVELIRDSDISLTNQERLEKVNEFIHAGDNVILLTTMLSSGNDSGSEIIYALRDTDNLAEQISDNIQTTGIDVLKYYQLREPTNTSLDFYEIIREANNTESLIVSFGYADNSFDNSFLQNNIDILAKAVSDAIYNYISKENIYIVKSGDTLYSIALKFKVTVDRLKKVNNLATNALTIGQELIIPEPEKEEEDENLVGFITYTVKSGDSLYSIARNYNTTVNVLKDINNLTSNTLSIGQTLKIPTTTTPDTTPPTDNYISYTVKSGDSLYSIARNYNTTVDDIKTLNNLTSNLLSIGQILRIPTTTTTPETSYLNYTVKSGDSLYQIAIQYNTTVSEIKNLNNLTSNNLSIGQTLKIPMISNASNYFNYTVKSGDSLYSIARNYNTTVNEIKKLNNLTSDALSIDQILKIPYK